MTQVGQQPYSVQGPYNLQQHQQPFVQQQQQQHQQTVVQQQQQQNVAFGHVQNAPYATYYTASGTPIQVVNVVASDQNTYHGYNTLAAKILGWMQIICGLIILIAQIIVSALHSDGYQGGVGFYASAFFILAGSFGVRSSASKSRCTVVATLVLSIIAALVSTGPITQGSVGIIRFLVCYSTYEQSHPAYECGFTTSRQVAMACHAITLSFGLIEGIVAIVAAAYCCHGCCCYSKPGAVIYQNHGMDSSRMETTATQHNPTQYYPAATPMATVPTSSYSNPNNALPLLPAYSASASPPEYTEKV